MDVERGKNCEDRLDKDKGKTENKEPEITCSICLEEIQEKDATESVPCAHIYHESCLRTSLSYNIRCPICRSEIREFRRVLSDTPVDVPQNGIGDSNNNNRNTGMRLVVTSGEIQQIRETVGGVVREHDIISRHLETTSARLETTSERLEATCARLEATSAQLEATSARLQQIRERVEFIYQALNELMDGGTWIDRWIL